MDRPTRRLFDHIKPETLSIDSSVNKVEVWQSKFKLWIIEFMRPDSLNNDPIYVFDSLICLLDNGWQTDASMNI